AHYSVALGLAAAAKDASTQELQAKALRYLTLAGDRALGIDVQAAERHYARALEVTLEDDPHRPGLLVKSGEALRQRGGFPGAARASLGDAGGLQDMRRALDTAADQGLGREVALLQYNLGEVLWPIEGPRAALEALREGGAFAERRGIEELVLDFQAGML